MILTDETVTYTLAEITLCSMFDGQLRAINTRPWHEQSYWPQVQEIIDLCHQQRLSEQDR